LFAHSCGEKTLAKAAPIQFGTWLSVIESSRTEPDRKSISRAANRGHAQAEVEKKRAHDLEEWRQRGLGGIVREVNAQTARLILSCAARVPGIAF